jgi:phage shock protein PspC (stress-responsive transcriptional regulator)
VAGVASGAAAALGISVGWARFLFVALALFGGFGLLLYVVGWLTMPEDGSATSLAQDWLRGVDDGGRWLGIGLIVIGAVVFFSATGLVRAGWLWAGLLLLAGVLLYQGDLAGPRAAASPELPGEAEGLSPSWEPAPEATDATDAVSTEADAEAAVVVGPPTRRRSILGRLTIGSLFVVLGIMALLDTADLADPLARHYVAAVVAVLGAALVIGAWWGRTRAAIVIGVLVIPVLIAATASRVDFSGNWGDYSYRPVVEGDIANGYDLAAGDLRIDLRSLDMSGPVEIEAEVGAGQLVVIVPRDADVHVDAHVGIGELELLGIRRGGIDVERAVTSAGPGERIDLDIETGFGRVEVIRSFR